MYIKSVVIDGFKSYAQRTEVNGFDPMFNAITGLNGSGKSNILDSICFVLGISNLTQVGNSPTTSNIGVSLISLHHTPRPHTLNRVIRNLMRLAHI